MEIPKALAQEMKKKQYGLFGHSAVQICGWTKKVLQGKDACYKQHFYGIHTHKCMQLSPAALWCSNSCVYCWRPVELMNPQRLKWGKPEEIVAGLISERRKLLSGFGGRTGIDAGLWKDSLVPDHFAISLSGEPCIYPHLPELIKYLKEEYKARSVFLVTNGTFPGMIKRLVSEDALPHQLYISVVAADRGLYNKIVKPKFADAWERLRESLGIRLSARKVLRLTLIKGVNDKNISKFGEMLEGADADFIELKAYMFLGYSRNRLRIENMPLHREVREYADKLGRLLPSFELADEHAPSRIVLFKNKRIEQKLLIPSEESNKGPNHSKESACKKPKVSDPCPPKPALEQCQPNKPECS